ncbi:Glycerol kinase [bacterium HR40]|nr:Glycerol kinase [bacterium HR40]
MQRYILAIDQGTSSTRAILFDRDLRPVASAQQPLTLHVPADGWVEQDPEDIWRDTVAVCHRVLAEARTSPAEVAGIGIANQRETTLLWDRETGEPVARAIVWQDRRTADLCRELVAEGFEEHVRSTTGLLPDPYFSATKLAWLLDYRPDIRRRAETGRLAFGTVDSFLLWRLTAGRIHATDASNAARTLLFDIHRQTWDETLLRRLRIPAAVLPEVRDSAGEFGATAPTFFGQAIAICGVAGDQQAASFGQACVRPGMLKSTFGTGCFALLNTGHTPVTSHHRLLATIAWRLGGRVTYALEGSMFVAGAAIQWLRDGLGLIDDAAESERLAAAVPDTGGVEFVPAFTGLGAPWWDPDARGAILGLTRATRRAHIVRAALEAVACSTRDLVDAMDKDVRAGGGSGLPEVLRIDGGMAANDWFCQYLADILDRPVERPESLESTARGAAALAALGAGLLTSVEAIADGWRCERRFEPRMAPEIRTRRLASWADAVARVLGRQPSGGARFR